MKRSRFSEEQIIAILKEQEAGMATADVCRACNLVGVSRRVIRYRPLRPDDSPLRQRLRELAAECRRFGYRRLGYVSDRGGE